MVAGLSFLATAIATLFAQATSVRWSRSRAPHHGAWTVALAMYAAASAAAATGESTGWDAPTFRVFYLFGAVLNVPWLGLGTLSLLAPPAVARRARAALLVASGFAAGVLVTAPLHGTIAASGIPEGRDHFDTLPRVLAAAGSGLGAIVVLAGASWSAVRFARAREQGGGRLALGNVLIALGVLVNATGGLAQGLVGEDEAFAISLVVGIAAIYAGFAVVSSDASSRRRSLPPSPRGSDATTVTRVGTL